MTPDPSAASDTSATVASRILRGVSQAPPRARSHALIPEAAPTVVIAAAAHCMHIAARGYRDPVTGLG